MRRRWRPSGALRIFTGSESASRRRLFFALWPADEVAAPLHAAAVAAHADCGGRVMRRDSLHLTLAFLGDVMATRVADAEAAAANVTASAFTFDLDRLGYWKHNRIAWAGCVSAPPALTALAEKLAQALRAVGFQLEDRAFAAHVTLLRNAVCPPAASALAAAIRWPVMDFALVESHAGAGGSRYAVRRRWPLRGPRG